MHKRLVFILLFLFLLSHNLISQTKTDKPKLIVGIIVDQMYYGIVERYWNKLSENGFKKIINNGFYFKNIKHYHFPTYTATGHAAIYTGTYPSINGICGNDWYDREQKKIVYCVEDLTVNPVGTESNDGEMSPKNLLVNTITDELRNSNNFKSKIISISLKDRGAVIPSGKNGIAYWFDIETNDWITSSYYMIKLPEYIENFNNKNLPEFYLSKDWNTLLPIEQYTESSPDDSEFEDKFKGEEKPIFPHKLPQLKDKNRALIRYTPFGNTITKELAKEIIDNEKLGEDDYTDFLNISFSSTDYAAHKFGPYSIEIQDIYLRLDLDIEELIEYIDKKIGNNNTLYFVTSDHGGSLSPLQWKSQGIESGTFYNKPILDTINYFLNMKYGIKKLGIYFLNQQLYLDREIISSKRLNLTEIRNYTKEMIKKNVNGVEDIFTVEDLEKENNPSEYFIYFKNGYHYKRSGDIFINFKKYWIEERIKGAEHGSPYEYDTHVPLIFYGWEIPVGESYTKYSIVDIFPTLSKILDLKTSEINSKRSIDELINLIK